MSGIHWFWVGKNENKNLEFFDKLPPKQVLMSGIHWFWVGKNENKNLEFFGKLPPKQVLLAHSKNFSTNP